MITAAHDQSNTIWKLSFALAAAEVAVFLFLLLSDIPTGQDRIGAILGLTVSAISCGASTLRLLLNEYFVVAKRCTREHQSEKVR